MANSKPVTKIEYEFVEAVLKGWSGDLAFTKAAVSQMRRARVGQIDVLEIVEDGETTTLAKELPHEVHFTRTGRTLAGTHLRVTLSYDHHLPYLCVEEVTVL